MYPTRRMKIGRSPLFDPSVRSRYEQELTYTRSAYLDLLMTYSGHRTLRPHRRVGLLRCTAELIHSRYGGTVTKRYLYELRIAKKVEVGSSPKEDASRSAPRSQLLSPTRVRSAAATPVST